MIDKLLKLLKIKFAGDLILKDGTPLLISGDLAVGVEVKVAGPDGPIPLPAGPYELESGQIITVDDKGVITDIVDVVDVAETPDVETGTPTTEEVVVEEEPKKPEEEKPVEEKPVEPTTDLEAKIKELEEKIKALEDKIMNLSADTEKNKLEFSSEIDLIKTKANFTKEISRNSTPDVVVTSPIIDKINHFRQLKK
jgi:hypothetical protein